jgi:hypothetical protein
MLCWELLYWKITSYFKVFLSGHLNRENATSLQEPVETSPRLFCPSGIRKQGISENTMLL